MPGHPRLFLRLYSQDVDARDKPGYDDRSAKPNFSDLLRCRGVAERVADLVDDLLDQDAVVALAHHPDHRLGAGGADQQAALAVEAFFAVDDRRFHPGMVERLAAAVAHILEDLRQRIEAMADFRHRPAKFLHHGEHLQRGDEAVAGGGIVGQDDMARRLAAEIVALLQHLLEHVAVADRRAHHADALAFEEAFEPEIGHHGGDDTGLGETAVFLPALRDHSQKLVAVDHMAALVDQDDAIGIAIERDADIGAHLAHLLAQRFRRGRAAFLVDVETIGIDAHRDDVGAKLPQRFRHHLVGSPVGTIDHHAQSVERELARQRTLGEFDVAVMDAVDAAGAAEAGALRQMAVDRLVEQLLDLLLDIVGQFEALRAEQLDAVVLEQVVGRRNHHAEISAHRLGQHRDRRRRDRAEQQHVHADRGKAGHHGVFDHVAGKARVLADDDAVAVIAALKYQPGRLPHLERELRCDETIGAAPNPVGTEIFAAHVTPSIPQDSPTGGFSHPGRNPRTPSIIACRSYNPPAAKMASKNMMNHYGRLRCKKIYNPLL